MINRTPVYGLPMPEENDNYSLSIVNEVTQKTEDALVSVSTQLGEITLDCGTFDGDTPVIKHNVSDAAHPNLIAYGGTLEEHMVDRQAHDNIILDGNVG